MTTVSSRLTIQMRKYSLPEPVKRMSRVCGPAGAGIWVGKNSVGGNSDGNEPGSICKVSSLWLQAPARRAWIGVSLGKPGVGGF